MKLKKKIEGVFENCGDLRIVDYRDMVRGSRGQIRIRIHMGDLRFANKSDGEIFKLLREADRCISRLEYNEADSIGNEYIIHYWNGYPDIMWKIREVLKDDWDYGIKDYHSQISGKVGIITLRLYTIGLTYMRKVQVERLFESLQEGIPSIMGMVKDEGDVTRNRYIIVFNAEEE